MLIKFRRIVRRRLYISIAILALKRLGLGSLLVLISLGVFSYTRAGAYIHTRGHAYAVTSSTLNFQARLLQASGAIVPDANYSIVFSLYTVSSGGTAEWSETQASVATRGGYLSVNLGSSTPFVSTIDWSQEHWMTMNVNGDGNMTPYIKLTAVPYAFRAGQSDTLTNGSSTITADNLLQKAPLSLQSVNAAVAGLRFNQTGTGGLLQLQGNGVDVFTVSNTGVGVLTGASFSIGNPTQNGSLILSDGSSNIGTIRTAALGQDTIFTLPDPGSGAATICLTIGNCASSGYILNGGNTLGADISLGTNDNKNLTLRTNGTTRLAISNNGGTTITDGTVGNPDALTVDNSTSTGNILQLEDNAVPVFTVANGGLVTATQGLSLLNGLNNNSGGITNTGSLTGVGTNITASAGLTIASTGSNLVLNSGSGTVALGATTIQTTGGLSYDLNNAGNTTLTLTNSGVGFADLNISEGSLLTAGTSRLTNSGALQNIASLTGTGALTIASSSSGALTLNSASGTIILGAGTLSRTSPGITTFDLVDSSNTTFALTNSGTGQANLTADGVITAANGLIASAGGAQITGNTQVLGATTLKTTSNSANAVQIQNSNGDNIIRVDSTGGNQNNLITNPSFEVDVSGWSAKGTPTNFLRDATQAYDGSASLQVKTQATVDQGAKFNITGGLALSQKYSASFYIRLDNLSNLMTTLAVGYSSDGSTDNTPCTLNSTNVNSNGWTKINCSFTTPASFTSTPYFYIKQTDNVIHTFYIDGVLLQTDTNTDNNYRDGKVALQGTVVSPLVLQNATDSSNAFAVQNSSGTSIFNIDTTDTNTMITNPGFEFGISGWAALGGTTTIQRDTSQSWLGNASLQIASSNTANTGAKYTTANVQPTQLALSTTYTLSWYSKLSSGSFTDIKGRYSPDGGTTFVECLPTNATVVTTGWTRYSCTFNSGVTAVSANAFIAIVQTAAPGSARTFWVDAVQLELGSTATDYGAGSIYLNGTITSPVNFKNKDNSTTAFTVQNSAASPLFQIDTLNNIVYVGNATPDSTGVLIVLDNKNTIGDPATGVNGAMYYNSASQSYRCYRGVDATAADGVWEDCGKNPIDHGWSLEDDFVSGNVNAFGIGKLNWDLQTITTAATVSYNNTGANSLPPTIDRPGILRIRTNGSISRGSTLSLSGSNLSAFPVGAGEIIRTSVGMFKNAGGQFPIIRIGAHTESNTTTSPTAGVWFESNTAVNANWLYCYGNGAAQCTPTTIAIADTTWYKLEIRVISTTQVDFYLNGTKFSATGIIGLDVSTQVAPALTCFAGAAVSQDCFLDYYQISGGSGASR